MSEALNRARVLALLDSLDPAKVSPEEIELIRAEEMRKNPALVEEADRLLVRLRELVEALESLPPEELQRRLAELRAEDPEFAACVAGHLPQSPPQPALEPRPALTPEEVRPPDPSGYEILGELGRGGMGVVYQARQRALKRLVALKMILAGSAASDTQKARFQTEAELIARLQHPHIVQVYEVNEHEGLPFFSLELCDRGTLEDYLKEPLLPREAARLLQTLARAIHYAHSLQVIHRDLKPANVLLVRDGTTADGLSSAPARLAGLSPKITDFGLARLLDEVAPSQTGEIAGTPSYMSPEQASGDKNLGPATDIHALGAIFYRCLTGQPPFRGTSLLEVLRKVRTEDPVPPRRLNPAVPPDLDAICRQCLKKDPRCRYPTAEKLAEDLQRFLDHRETLARPLNWGERLWRGYCRAPISWSLFFVAVLVSLLWVVGLVNTANAKAERAQKDRNEADQRAHQARVDAAQQAAASGDWPAALASFKMAIADNYPDRRHLEVIQLPGLFMFGNTADTEAELTRLWDLREQLEPDDRARLLLARGEFLVSGFDTLDEARGFLQQALDTEKLSQADTAYVRGLLTDRLTDAIVLFREAIQIETAHASAHHSLLVALLIAGRFGEVREQAVVVRSKFPKDPLPGVIDAFLFLLEGDEVRWRVSLNEVRPLIGDERHREFVAFLGRLHKLYQTMIKAENDQPVGSSLDILKGVLELNWTGMKRTTPFSFNVPAAKWLWLRLLKFKDIPLSTGMVVVVGLNRQAPSEWIVNNSLAGMEKICTDRPEPIYSQLLGLVRMSKTLVLLNKGDKKAAALQQRIAALGLYEAAEAATLVPLSPTRYYCRAFGMLADQGLITQFHEEKDPAIVAEVQGAQRRLRDQVGLLMTQGRQFPSARAKVLTKILPAVLDRDILIPLLLDWEIEENSNPAPGIIRVQMLLKHRNIGAAFDEARLLLQRFPDNPTLTRLLEETQKKLFN